MADVSSIKPLLVIVIPLWESKSVDMSVKRRYREISCLSTRRKSDPSAFASVMWSFRPSVQQSVECEFV